MLSRVTRICTATQNTWRGLAYAARTERAVQEELGALAVGVFVGFLLAPNAGWYVGMVGALILVVAVELLNTALEKLADHVTPEWNETIGIVKDIGSAAVFCSLLLAALVWAAALYVALS
jgi:diacylglycerol kinase (ATP)